MANLKATDRRECLRMTCLEPRPCPECGVESTVVDQVFLGGCPGCLFEEYRKDPPLTFPKVLKR
jgi:hypothetical protein